MKTLAEGTAAQVERKAIEAIRQTDGGFILGPGFSIEVARTPAENLLALKRAFERTT